MFRIDMQRDVEKSHGISFQIGGSKGVNFTIQWRSWQSIFTDETETEVYDPWMLSFNVFVWGTFLGARPFSDTYLGRRCCSNGVNIFHWTVIKAREE